MDNNEFSKKLTDLIQCDFPKINDSDWDKIIISRKGKNEDENQIYNKAIVNIAFPVKPKFSYQKNRYGTDYVYKYEASYEDQNFGLVLEKYYCLGEYFGSVKYGCIETISYEEILEKIKNNPYNFLESCLESYVCELIEGSSDLLKTENCGYVIKRRFYQHNLNVLEYFSDNIKLINGDSFIKGQLILFGSDMLLGHLYVTSKTKITFNENYYEVFIRKRRERNFVRKLRKTSRTS